jgi:integrase
MDYPRCLVLFNQAIKTERTKQNYNYCLSKFLEFAKSRIANLTVDSLSKIPQKQGQILIEDYVFYLKNKELSGRSIKNCITPLKLFFEMNDKSFNWLKIQKMIPENDVFIQDEPHTKETIIKMLANMRSVEDKALLMVLASSGCRVGMVLEFRICDMKPMPDGSQCITVYARTRSAYTTFITAEAYQSVQDWLAKRKQRGENLTTEDLVFPRKPSDYSAYFSGLCRTLGISDKIGNHQRRIKAVHGLRKRFNTILKSKSDINPSLAERLLGHSVSIRLDNAYFRPSESDLFATYQKIIPDLVIDEKYHLQNEIAQKEAHIQTLQDEKDNKIKELEQKLELISQHLSNLSIKS